MCLSTTCDQSLAHHSAIPTWLPLRKSGLKKNPGIKKNTTSRDISECTFQDFRRDRLSTSSLSKSAKQRQPPALPGGDRGPEPRWESHACIYSVNLIKLYYTVLYENSTSMKLFFKM